MSAVATPEVESPATSDPGSSGRRKNRHRAVPLGNEFRKFSIAASNLEVRAAKNTNELVVTGEPIVYDTPYDVNDMFGTFRERIMPGSLTDILDSVDCRLLLNHEGIALARNTSGTLDLKDSSQGLLFEARMDARMQAANDFAIAVERGDMNEMSVGMVVGRDEWGEETRSADSDETIESRTITRLSDLVDVSGVTYACSPTTSIGIAERMASALPVESRARLRRLEVALRDGTVKPEDILEALAALRGGGEATGSRQVQRAAQALQTVLEDVGVDPEVEEEDEPEVTVEEVETEEPAVRSSLHLQLALRQRRRA